MKLKGLLAFEVAFVTISIVAIMFFVEVTPYLASSKPGSQIGVYNQKLFTEGNVTISKGQIASARFNYSSYDPAILVVDLIFQSWQNPGYLSIYCNGLHVTTINVQPENPHVVLTTISVSGFDVVNPRADLVSPAPVDAFTYGNEVAFIPELQNGYEGTFSYQISIRGSR
jgi:hypothetical protein